MTTLEQLLAEITELFPFDIVQGDAIHRLSPGNQQVVNANDTWLVSQPNRSAHKLQKSGAILNDIPTLLQDQTARIRELETAVEAYRDLCLCYRLNKRPSEALFRRLNKADTLIQPKPPAQGGE